MRILRVNPSNRIERWYLVMVHFSEGPEALIERLKSDLPVIEATLKNLSSDRYKLLMRSANGQTVSWLLRTASDSKQISARIHNPEGTTRALLQQRSSGPDTSRRGDKIVGGEQ